jgi:4-hydroxymandelate oxidase
MPSVTPGQEPRPGIEDLAERARARLPETVFEYVMQGADAWVSAGEAAPTWAAHRFWPHVLRDVTEVDPGVTLLGVRSALPFGVAPTSLQRAIHPDGEVGMARACVAAGVPMVVSSNAGTPFADIGATGVRWWLQVYLPAERTLALPLLARARAAGADAVVLTVDTPAVSTKYAPSGRSVWDDVDPEMIRVNFDPDYEVTPGSEKAPDLGPHDVAWLAVESGLPVVVKGVLRGDDARRAVDAGAAAVWVSNHGGRQLDRAVPTATALPLVAEAVGESAEVYVDGGIRCGLDVLAALARGARAAFLGRPPALALVDGEPGVTRLLSRLGEETVEALRLAGCRGVGDAPGTAVPRTENAL